MSEYDISSPTQQSIADLSGDFFEFCIFDLVPSGELLDHELAISTKFYFCSADFYCASDSEKSCGIFCDIIGRVTDIFMTFFNWFSCRISYKNTTTRWSWIAS
jgi:hypothetical protein